MKVVVKLVIIIKHHHSLIPHIHCQHSACCYSGSWLMPNVFLKLSELSKTNLFGMSKRKENKYFFNYQFANLVSQQVKLYIYYNFYNSSTRIAFKLVLVFTSFSFHQFHQTIPGLIVHQVVIDNNVCLCVIILM